MKINKYFITAGIAIILIVGGTIYISHSLKKTPQVNFTAVKKTDITQAVKTDGSVSSAQDLSLAFEQGGVVTQINVKEGDSVKKGQLLVSLDSKNSAATVSQASAALAVAQANYQKVIDGSTNQQTDVSRAAVASAQTALDNANASLATTQAQQDTAVSNALATMLNTSITAIAGSNNTNTPAPIITGTYTGTDQGIYNISIYATGNGLNFKASGLESSSGQVQASPVALGTKGLFIQFNSAPSTSDTWSVSIPNTFASSYIANYNAYQTALKTRDTQISNAQSQINTAQSALAQAQANLQLQLSPPRPEDLAAAQAQVQIATAQLQTARNIYSENFITAPVDGTITSVDTKVGQTVAGSTIAPGPTIIKMISNEKFQIITYISEVDVAKIKLNDAAQVTLDAYGSGTNFDANVISIDPAATVNNGVSTYKTTLQFNQDDNRIKTGMSASIVITDSVHQNALVIPATAVIKKDNQNFVLADSGNGQVKQVQIQTGISSLDGFVEVLSGLSEGQRIAAFGNSNQ